MKSKLYIIDEPSTYIFFIKKVLLNDGYEVKISSDERDISRDLTQYRPDLILIDVHLNRSTGFEYLKKIRIAYKFLAPIIVISSGKDVQEIEKAFDYGAYDYLIKPLNLRDLKNKIRQALTKQEYKNKSCKA